MMKKSSLFFICTWVLAVLADSRYKIPADLGMPLCFNEGRPCSQEDWVETAKTFNFKIRVMVAHLVAQEIQEPICYALMNCEEGVIENYLLDYKSIELKVQEMIKKENHLVGWWD